MNKETIIQNKTRCALGIDIPGVRMFRNQVGRYCIKGRWISSGLAPGSHDLIGITAIEITPEMVGTYVGVFTSIEMKQPGEHIKPGSDQDKWRTMVRKFGGISFEAHSSREAIDKLTDGLKLVDVDDNAC